MVKLTRDYLNQACIALHILEDLHILSLNDWLANNQTNILHIISLALAALQTAQKHDFFRVLVFFSFVKLTFIFSFIFQFPTQLSRIFEQSKIKNL